MRTLAAFAVVLALSSVARAQGDPRDHDRRAADEERRMAEEAARREAGMMELRRAEDELARAQESGNKEETAKWLGRVEALRAMLKEGGEHRPPGPPPGPMQPGQPGHPGMRGPSAAEPFRRPVTTEDIERAMVWMKENEPERFEKIQALKKDKPDVYKRAQMDTAMEIRELLKLKEMEPERYEQRLKVRQLDTKARALADKVRASQEGEGKESARAELKKVLGDLFDLREKEKELELKRLEEEISRLKESMQKRRDAKDKIVERRMEEMTGEDEDLGW